MNVYIAWRYSKDRWERDPDVIAICSTSDKAKLACLRYELDYEGYLRLEWQDNHTEKYHVSSGENHDYAVSEQTIDEMILANMGEKL